MSCGRFFFMFEQMEQLRYSDGETVRFLDAEEVEVPFTPELLVRDGDDMLAGGGDLAQSFLVDSFDQQLSGAELWMSGTAFFSVAIFFLKLQKFVTCPIIVLQRGYYCP